jgi:hypothetical protein
MLGSWVDEPVYTAALPCLYILRRMRLLPIVHLTDVPPQCYVSSGRILRPGPILHRSVGTCLHYRIQRCQ